MIIIDYLNKVLYCPFMERDEIKIWLKSIKKNHAWLAEQCCASIHSINGWLSSGKKITLARQAQIARLMEQYPAGTSASSISDAPENTLVLTADASTFDAWNEAAAREGKLLRQWACDVLTEQASK